MSTPDPAYRSEPSKQFVDADEEGRPVTTRDKLMGIAFGLTLAGVVLGLAFWILG